MPVDFVSAVNYLHSSGTVRVLLPFILVFTLIYAILQKAQLFGENAKRIHGAIAAIIGLVFVFAPYENVLGYNPIDMLFSILQGSALIITVILTVLIALALLLPKEKLSMGGSPIVGLVGLLGVLALGYIIVANIHPAFIPESWLSWLKDSSTTAFIIMLLVFGLVIWFITSEPQQESGTKRLHKFVKELTGD